MKLLLANSNSKITISPRAKRAMGRLGLDGKGISGSGPNGRILETDVLRAGENLSRDGARPKRTISMMRRAIAERTAQSFSTIPHFYLEAEADATELVSFREKLLPQLEKECGVRLTLTDLFLKAMALALGKTPGANAVWRDNTIVPQEGNEIGLVVNVSDGLLIPVLKGLDRKSLKDLSQERAKLVASARGGQLSGADLEGGATSLSNLGNARVDRFSAVIPLGQSSILSVGRTALRPFVVNRAIAARMTVILCLAADHRVMDGAIAAEFLGRIVEHIENPASMGRP